jgi:D,D-heptose 1,7-bisphosphate phosphatase
MRRAVFLDRDGTINRMVYNSEFGLVDSPANPDEFDLLPRVGEAIHRINQLGFLAIVVSNQPGIAKARFSMPLLEATTSKMHLELERADARLDGVYYCLHHPQARLEEYRLVCECRKPKPGMLRQAARDLEIDLSRSYLIGDGVTDLLAGQLAGSQTIFLCSRKCYVCDEMARQQVQPNYVVANLSEAVHVIEKVERGEGEDLSAYLPTCLVGGALMLTERESLSEDGN